MKNGEKSDKNAKGRYIMWLSDSTIRAVSALRLELAMMRRNVWRWQSIVGGNIRQSGMSPNNHHHPFTTAHSPLPIHHCPFTTTHFPSPPTTSACFTPLPVLHHHCLFYTTPFSSHNHYTTATTEAPAALTTATAMATTAPPASECQQQRAPPLMPLAATSPAAIQTPGVVNGTTSSIFQGLQCKFWLLPF